MTPFLVHVAAAGGALIMFDYVNHNLDPPLARQNKVLTRFGVMLVAISIVGALASL